VKHLFPIEVRREESPNVDSTGLSGSPPPMEQGERLTSDGQIENLTSDSTRQAIRPRRLAAIAGEQKRRNI